MVNVLLSASLCILDVLNECYLVTMVVKMRILTPHKLILGGVVALLEEWPLGADFESLKT